MSRKNYLSHTFQMTFQSGTTLKKIPSLGNISSMPIFLEPIGGKYLIGESIIIATPNRARPLQTVSCQDSALRGCKDDQPKPKAMADGVRGKPCYGGWKGGVNRA